LVLDVFGSFLTYSFDSEIVPGQLFIVYAGYRAPIGVTNREFTAVRKLIGTDFFDVDFIIVTKVFQSLLYISFFLSFSLSLVCNVQ
jgi:hypothetical protein